ncbi:MAG: enoyl-CoA hydratase [Rhizobiales bacterium]|nr:enoyl-CoA hydratase [Hyphomicrobiales bacterium]
MTEMIQRSLENGVLTLTMNRPDKKNALTEAMYAALADGLEEAERDPQIRVTLILANGDAFTAGNDMGDFAARGSADPKPQSNETHPTTRFLQNLATIRKPLVAGVNGLAVGVGVTMLLHCDLAFAGKSATFAMPFVNLGLVPEAGSTFLLPRLIGQQKSAQLLLLGKKIDADKAEALGLVAEVVSDDKLRETATAAAHELAAKAPNAVLATKALLRDGDRDTVMSQMKEEGEIFAAQLRSAEVKEAISAFFEKRKPDFSKVS